MKTTKTTQEVFWEGGNTHTHKCTQTKTHFNTLKKGTNTGGSVQALIHVWNVEVFSDYT